MIRNLLRVFVLTLMAKEKSKTTQAMDELQASVRPFLKELGFRGRARAFNRTTSDGITQVIEFQLGRFDPPGTQYVGFRQNLYGKFTVNVGVYVPEMHKYTYPGGGELPFVHEYDCWIRARLGTVGPEHHDIWWDLESVHEQAAEVFHRIERDALPFLARFETRDAILQQWMQENSDVSKFDRSRQQTACAIIMAIRGRRGEARSILSAALRQLADHPSAQMVRGLFEKLGLGEPES
jgi:hypothetical protein